MWIAEKSAAQRITVLLLIPHLGGGGAEQVVRLLARGLSSEKYDTHLALITEKEVPPNDLPPWVSVSALGARRVRSAAFKLVRLIWRLKPDVILSGMAHLNFLVLLLRPSFPRGTRVLVRQNATVSSALNSSALPVYTRLLYRLLYRCADRVVCQSSAMAGDLARETGAGPEQITVLPNPVDTEAIRKASTGPIQWSGPGPHLLAVGRLAPEKGFDMLLRAFAIVRHQAPNADLVIAGAGSEEAALKTDCRLLGLDQSVRFVGYLDSPYSFFSGATLFVLSSRHEGMPNALLEAAAAGLPIVACPASGGVVDFLRHRPHAWLAPQISTDALASTTLRALIELHRERRHLFEISALCNLPNPTPSAFSTSIP
jgi:glycosyltransferase involved in cell wall biosynthesis